MQVTLPSTSAPTAEAIPAASAAASTPSADFAMLLATLLAPVQPGVAGTLVAATQEASGDSAEEQPEATGETADGDASPDTVPEAATTPPILVAASALPAPAPTTTPQGSQPETVTVQVGSVAPTAKETATSAAAPKTGAPALVTLTPLPAPKAEAAPTGSKAAPAESVIIEPPETATPAPPAPVEAAAITEVPMTSETPVNTSRPEAVAASKVSTAAFSVEANPAREAAEAIVPIGTPAKAAAPAETAARQAPKAATVSNAAPSPAAAAGTPQVASAVLATAKAVVAGPVVTPDQPSEPETTPEAVSAGTDESADAPEALPKASADTPRDAKAPQRPAAAHHAPDEAQQSPEPAVVLEKNTAVLAKNALNEHVRGASSRELLAGARTADARAEKPAEAPGASGQSGAIPMDAAQRVALRPPATLAHLATRSPEPHVMTTFPEVGNEVLKQVALTETPGERTLTLKLMPASLGEVGVELKSSPAELVVRLVSQDPAVRDALEHHAVGLRETLARDGRETRIEIGSHLMTNMGQTHDNAQGNRQAAQQDLQEKGRFLPHALYGSEPTRDSVPLPVERRTASHSGVLNLFA